MSSSDPTHFVKPNEVRWTACGKRAAIWPMTRKPQEVTCFACRTHVRKVETAKADADEAYGLACFAAQPR